MYYYRRLDRQKRKLAIPFNYSIRCARADMTVTDIWLLWSLETVAMRQCRRRRRVVRSRIRRTLSARPN